MSRLNDDYWKTKKTHRESTDKKGAWVGVLLLLALLLIAFMLAAGNA